MITPAMDRARPSVPDLFNRQVAKAAKTEPAQICSESHVGVTDADPRIDAMLAFLRGKGWIKRDVVFAAIGVSDRVGRALKAASGGLIISDSQHGYKHILDADKSEFQHAENEIRSRIEELEKYLRNMQHEFQNTREAA